MTWLKKNSSLFFLFEFFISLAETKGKSGNHIHNSLSPKNIKYRVLVSQQSSLIFFSPCWWAGYATLPFFASTLEVNCGILFKERMNIWELSFFFVQLCNWMLNTPSIKLNLSIYFLQGITTCPPSGEKCNTRNAVLLFCSTYELAYDY